MSDQDPSFARGQNGYANRQSARRRTTIVWGLILVLLVVAAVGGKKAYRWIKASRADQFAAAADALVKEDKVEEAVKKYRAALQLDPLGYRGLAGAARLATKYNRPEALGLWEQVVKQPEATTADRLDYAEVLLRVGRSNVAEPILTPLLKGDPDTRTLELASLYCRKTGDDRKALEFARLAVKRAPQDDLARFQLASLLAEAKDANQHVEAKKILFELAEKEGPCRQTAIEALGRAPELSAEELNRVLKMLEPFSTANIQNSLMAADLRLQLRAEAADRIYDQTIARWNASSNADLIELSRWLNLHQQPERVISMLSVDRAFQDNQLLLSRLDALAIMQRWNDIDSLLGNPDLTLDPSVLESFRARTAQERNSTLEAEVHWNHAISLAAGDAMKLRFIANFAEQSHATAVALRAFELLGKFPEQAGFAYQGTQRLSVRTGNASGQRAAAEKISKLNPDDPNAADQLAYLNLLLGADVETNSATARKLVEKYPDRLAYRITAALAYLRQQDPGPALAQFQGPAIEWQKTPPSWRAVYAATLIANDQADAAREIIASIPRDKLSAEEQALLEPK